MRPGVFDCHVRPVVEICGPPDRAKFVFFSSMQKEEDI